MNSEDNSQFEVSRDLTEEVIALREERRAVLDQINSLVKALGMASLFIKYARYELKPGKATIGDQFPKQEDADEMIATIKQVITGLEISFLKDKP